MGLDLVAAKSGVVFTARLLMDKEPLPPMGSNDMGKRCEAMIKLLGDKADDILLAAADVVNKVAESKWNRDHIRTQPITDGIFAHFGLKKGGTA